MTLAADEFIRRFLLHALPDGFHRIHHYGFLANRHRTDKLAESVSEKCCPLWGPRLRFPLPPASQSLFSIRGATGDGGPHQILVTLSLLPPERFSSIRFITWRRCTFRGVRLPP